MNTLIALKLAGVGNISWGSIGFVLAIHIGIVLIGIVAVLAVTFWNQRERK